MSNTSQADLVQQGLTAARVGDVEDARRLLKEATRQMPNNVEAWLGLAGVVDSLPEKKKCFKEVLALDPDNNEAKAGLALVEQKLANQSGPAAAAPVEPHVRSADGPKPVEAESGLTACYRHPNVTTGLRCNRCGKPICPKCAVRTPVGFRCPDCIREQEAKYYSGGNLDYLIAAVVAFPLSLIAAGLFTFILGGFGFFIILIALFAAPAVGGFIAEAVRWAVKKRRSRYLGHVVAACLILATAPFLILMLLQGNVWGLLAPGMFVFLGSTTVLARLR
jgi:hypothetical protein